MHLVYDTTAGAFYSRSLCDRRFLTAQLERCLEDMCSGNLISLRNEHTQKGRDVDHPAVTFMRNIVTKPFESVVRCTWRT